MTAEALTVVRDRVFCRLVPDSWNPRFAEEGIEIAVEIGDQARAQRGPDPVEP